MQKKPKEFVFRPWFISTLRRCFKRYPPYYNTLNSVKTYYTIKSKNGKDLVRVSYKCNKCKDEFKSSQVVVDHIIPVIDPTVGFPINPDGSDDWLTFIRRLFCGPENLQVLCKTCHDEKTGKETKLRVKSRKKLQSNKNNSNIKKGKQNEH